MKILVINAYAGSLEMGMVFRHYYLAKEWIKNNDEVVIVAGTYSHLRRVNSSINHDLAISEEDGVRFLWLCNEEYQGNGFGRAKNMMQFSSKLLRYAEKIVRQVSPDIVLASCTNPLDTYGAQRIAKIAKVPLIHEVRDLWPITLIEMYGVSKWNPLSMIMQIGENSMCKHADRVTSVLPASEAHFISHGLQKDKFRFIPNGIVEEEWVDSIELIAEYKEVFDNLKANGFFIICFFGSHTKSYALSQLIHAVQNTKDKVAVVFVGKGNYKSALIEEAGVKNNERFVFLDPVEKKYIPALLKSADALYVGGIKNNIFKYGVAMNKLFDSMMSGKPILYAVEAPNNYIEEYHAGISVEPEDEYALQHAIEELIHLDQDELKKMGLNGKKAVLDHFTYKVIAKEFIELFRDCLYKEVN